MVDLSSVSGWLRVFVGVRVVTDHLLAEPLWVASSPPHGGRMTPRPAPSVPRAPVRAGARGFYGRAEAADPEEPPGQA